MIKYIKTTHTGEGFYTAKDRAKMPTFKWFGGLAIVDGDCDEWIAKVKGREITEAEANTMLEQRFNKSKALEIVQKTKELKDLTDKVYDFKDF